jgi:hypothetical protein
MYRALHLYDTLQLRAGTIRVFASCAATKKRMLSVAHLIGIDPISIETYDDWCGSVYRDVVGLLLPINTLTDEIDSELIRIVARYAVNWGFAEAPKFDVLILDDAQNFSMSDLEFIVRMGRHVTLFLRSSDVAATYPYLGDVQAVLSRGAIDVTLTESYQRNRGIPDFVSRLRGDISSSIPRASSLGTDAPFYFEAQDDQTELRRLSEIVRERMLLNETIGILVPDVALGHDVAHGLKAHGLLVELEDAESFPAPDFSSSRPKIFTYNQARCLNFETVLIPKLSISSYLTYSDSEILDLLTKVSDQATHWLYLSCSTPPALEASDHTATSSSVAVIDQAVERAASSHANRKPLVITPLDDLL